MITHQTAKKPHSIIPLANNSFAVIMRERNDSYVQFIKQDRTISPPRKFKTEERIRLFVDSGYKFHISYETNNNISWEHIIPGNEEIKKVKNFGNETALDNIDWNSRIMYGLKRNGCVLIDYDKPDYIAQLISFRYPKIAITQANKNWFWYMLPPELIKELSNFYGLGMMVVDIQTGNCKVINFQKVQCVPAVAEDRMSVATYSQYVNEVSIIDIE